MVQMNTMHFCKPEPHLHFLSHTHTMEVNCRVSKNVSPSFIECFMKPSSDLYFECQQNPTLISQCANLSDEEKIDKLTIAAKHTEDDKSQRKHYNEQCRAAEAV